MTCRARSWRAVVGLAAALVTASISGPARAVDVEAVGPWTIKSGEGKEGAYCTAALKTEDRELALEVTKKGRRSMFSAVNPAWRWKPRQSYATVLEVTDGRRPNGRLGGWTGDALALLPTALALVKTDGPDPVELLARGKVVNVMVGDTYMRFDVSTFAAAAVALERCVGAPAGQPT